MEGKKRLNFPGHQTPLEALPVLVLGQPLSFGAVSTLTGGLTYPWQAWVEPQGSRVFGQRDFKS